MNKKIEPTAMLDLSFNEQGYIQDNFNLFYSGLLSLTEFFHLLSIVLQIEVLDYDRKEQNIKYQKVMSDGDVVSYGAVCTFIFSTESKIS